jgi:ABC-type spermidine/putrescine transport system permease subunit II
MQPGSRAVSVLFLILVAVFLVAPIVVTASVSFTADEFMTFPPVGFSWRWYERIATDSAWRRAIANTLAIGLGCAGIATVVGTLVAYGISRLPPRGLREAALVFFLAPLAVPHMSLALALYPVFAPLGLIGTRLGVALGQSMFALPFVVLSVLSVIRRRDRELEAAARTLGAGPVAAFLRISLPLLAPGIAAGGILAFMTSFDDVTIPIFLAGIDAGTVPKLMLDSLQLDSDPSVMAASTAISLVGLGLFMLSALLTRRRS